jgi:hypothetical protein
MTVDSTNVQQPRQDELTVRLDSTILWLAIREFLEQEGQAERFDLDRIWPKHTVPRQQEVAELSQRNRRLHALVLALLERLVARGISVASAVALATTLGIDIPERLREKAQ